MTGRLADKTAIVTGAGSGIGEAAAQLFAAEGARVIVADINMDSATEVARELDGWAVQVDVADNHSVNTMAETAFTTFGNLDILVNNAGISHQPMPMEDVSEEEFDRVSTWYVGRCAFAHACDWRSRGLDRGREASWRRGA